MSSEAPAIIALGMACPLGLRSEHAVGAIEAGLLRFAEVDPPPTILADAVRVSVLEEVEVGDERTERASFFARHALTEALEHLGPLHTTRPVPCLLSLPEPASGPGLDLRRVTSDLLAVTGEHAGLRPELRASWLLTQGRAGAFGALELASSLLAEGYCDLALVGGLDSMVAPEVLSHLIEHERVRSDEARDGVIPGEGAAFLVLASPRLVPPDRVLARVPTVATGVEPHPLLGTEPSRAQGLTEVLARLRRTSEDRVDEVFSAQTGQGFYGRQLAYAHLRNAGLMPSPLRLAELGAGLGDAGAAAGVISIAHAITRMRPPVLRRLAAPLRSALAYGMSDHGAVGACVLTRP